MSKDRFILKQFAGETENNGVFGSYQAGTPTLSNNPEELQANKAWDKGWISAVSEDLQIPRLEEMQGVQYVLCKAVKNLYSSGIAPWDSGETYFKNALCSFVNSAGDLGIYKNKTGKNEQTAPNLDGENWQNLNIGVDIDSLLPVGTIIAYTGEKIPSSYLACDGSFIPKADFTGLYNIIGDRFYETLSQEDKRLEEYERWIYSLKEQNINPMIEGRLHAKYSAYVRAKEAAEKKEKERIEELKKKIKHAEERLNWIRGHYINHIRAYFTEVFSLETLIERLKQDKTPEDSYAPGHELYQIWKNQIWKYRDEYIQEEKNSITLPPLTEYNYYKNLERKARLKKEEILATHFALPNLNDGKFLQGANQAGRYNRAGLPNIWGNVMSIDYTATSYRGMTGGFYLQDFSGGHIRGGNWGSGGVITLDGSACSSIYGDSDTVQPRAIEVKYLIRYK